MKGTNYQNSDVGTEKKMRGHASQNAWKKFRANQNYKQNDSYRGGVPLPVWHNGLKSSLGETEKLNSINLRK